MKLFATPEAILGEIGTMETAEYDRRLDRATVSEFFNGKPPLTDEEAEAIGLTVNVNNLFGYTDLADTKAQALSLFTKPTEVFQVELDAVPQARIFERRFWEMESTAGWNELIKCSGRFKPAYEGCCGDAALHGEAVFTMPNATDWCPSQTPLSKILVPGDAPTDRSKLTHWAIETEITLREMHRYARGDFKGWKKGAMKKALARIYKDVDGVSADNVDAQNPEEMEYKRQGNTAKEGYRRRPALAVYYFYQVRCDKPGSPVDLTILLHKNEGVEGDATPADKVLFEHDCYFESISEVLNPAFMDCTLGGEPKWHRVLGTGTLNYGLNQAVEVLINRAMQGTMEGMMNLWQAADGVSREEIQEILMRHNGVVPENIKLIEQRFKPDLSGSLAMVNFFRQAGSRNARRISDSASDDKMLEVQAVQQQTQTEEASSARTANWYDHLDSLGRTMWARMVNPFIHPWEPGYSDVKKFQGRMERQGIPLYYLQPHNCKITAVRIIGDGSQQRERTAAVWLSQNRGMYPPQAQQRITRMVTAAMTGSHRIANELVPIQDKPDTSQILRAETESNTCIVQGRPMPVQDDDVDDVHFPVHLEAMIALVQRTSEEQSATFTVGDARAFKALGAHCVAHINKISQMAGNGRKDANKQKSKQWMQALNEVVSVGEQMAHNLRQQQEGQNEKPNPIEVAKLRLAAQQLQLSMEKLTFSREKWERQQMNKESDGSFRRMIELNRNDRENRLTDAKIGQGDIQTALEIEDRARGGAEQ